MKKTLIILTLFTLLIGCGKREMPVQTDDNKKKETTNRIYFISKKNICFAAIDSFTYYSYVTTSITKVDNEACNQ